MDLILYQLNSLFTTSLKMLLALHGYLRNVSENCKVGGYLIGTCYDGKTYI